MKGWNKFNAKWHDFNSLRYWKGTGLTCNDCAFLKWNDSHYECYKIDFLRTEPDNTACKFFKHKEEGNL